MRPILPAPPAAPVSGRYKVRPEDFEVEEIPAYAPSGEGTHSFLWVEKEGLSTLAACEALARALGVDKRAFGHAGLKDAQAVTRQWLSIEHVDPERATALDIPGVRVLEVSQHQNKLKPGHLRGNRFRILLRGARAEELGALRENLAWVEAEGLPNYFGEQRFGKRGSNLDQGLAILQHERPKRKAYAYAPRILKLLLSAVQSEVFNRVLLDRLDSYGTLIDGDLAWIHDKGASFTVQDPAAEQARAQRKELSPTGPLPGPKMLRANGSVGELEDRVLGEMEISHESFGFMRSHPGGRRPLRLLVHEPEAEACEGGLRVSFRLDAGGYATSVLRFVLEDAPWFG